MTEEREKAKSGVSRREFIAGTVGGLVVGAVAGTAVGSLAFPTTSQPWMPSSWDYTADVVVVGGGGSGLAAAYEAANAGSSVILLEKESILDMCDSCQCYGDIGAAGTSIQKAKGITDTPDQYYADMIAGNPRGNTALIRIAADNSAATVEWMISLGCTFQARSPVARPGMSVPRACIAQPDPRQWVTTVSNAAKAKGAQILLSNPATQLIRDPTRGVIGLYASNKAFRANKAVVLCAGDQNANVTLTEEFGSPAWFESLPVAGNTGDTGDGTLMAMGVGAQPMCLDMSSSPSPTIGILVGNGVKSPEGTYTAAGITYPGILSFAIFVNSSGNRFTNELGSTTAADLYAQGASSEGWLIYDSAAAAQDPVLAAGASYYHLPDLQSFGLAKQANTIADLATALDISSSGLAATVTKYNSFVTAGSDTDFKRPGNTMVAIQTPPFYGWGPFKIYSGMLSNGTLDVDTSLHVLDVNGKIIPHLYAAGDNGRAGFVGTGHGTHVNWAWTSGRLAGQNAAKETPWS